jgi:hypothetical protein
VLRSFILPSRVVAMPIHRVVPGECLSLIAYTYGQPRVGDLRFASWMQGPQSETLEHRAALITSVFSCILASRVITILSHASRSLIAHLATLPSSAWRRLQAPQQSLPSLAKSPSQRSSLR